MAIRKIQIRRDVATAWDTNNPVLDRGELGLDLTNNRLKAGDGVTAWQSLPYLHTRWEDLDGTPVEFPPEYHEHPISEVNNLQDELDSKSNLDGGNTFTGNQLFSDEVTVSGYLTLATQATNLTHAVRAERRVLGGTGLEVTNNGYLTADITLGIENSGVDTDQIADGAVTNSKIDTMEASKLTGVLGVDHGGTGNATYTEDYFLTGGGGNSPLKEKSPAQVLSEINAPSADDVVYLTGNQEIDGVKTFNNNVVLKGNLVSTESSINIGVTGGSSINLDDNGLGVLRGASGQNALSWTGNEVTLGAQGTAPNSAVRADRVVSAGDGLTGGGNLTGDISLGVDGTVVRTSVSISATNGLTGGGTLDNSLTIGIATGGVTGTHIAPGAITDNHIATVIPVNKGGTGRSSLTTNYFLTGNGTGAVQVVSPANALTQIGAIPITQKAAANGVATLDATSKIPLAQLPDGAGLPAGGTTGQVLAKTTNDDGDADWIDPPAGFDPLSYTPVVIGDGASVGTGSSLDQRIALGVGAEASGSLSSAIGTGTVASGFASIAIGRNSDATGSESTAIGQEASATGEKSLAVGTIARATTAHPLAIGYGTGRRLNYSVDEEALWTTTNASTTAGTGTRRYHPHSEEIIRIKSLTQVEYDALPVKDPATLYLVSG